MIVNLHELHGTKVLTSFMNSHYDSRNYSLPACYGGLLLMNMNFVVSQALNEHHI